MLCKFMCVAFYKCTAMDRCMLDNWCFCRNQDALFNIMRIATRHFFCALAGALAFLVTQSTRANLIVNGGFETGDFAGWTKGENSYPESIVNSQTTSAVKSGAYAAQIAGLTRFPDTLAQTVSTTSGQNYTFSFWRLVDTGSALANSLVVTWDGNVIFSEANVGFPPQGYQQFSFNVLGTGSDTIKFACANDPGYTFLDEVSLTPSLTAVPDGGATIAMLGLALAGITGFRRKFGN